MLSPPPLENTPTKLCGETSYSDQDLEGTGDEEEEDDLKVVRLQLFANKTDNVVTTKTCSGQIQEYIYSNIPSSPTTLKSCTQDYQQLGDGTQMKTEIEEKLKKLQDAINNNDGSEASSSQDIFAEEEEEEPHNQKGIHTQDSSDTDMELSTKHAIEEKLNTLLPSGK